MLVLFAKEPKNECNTFAGNKHELKVDVSTFDGELSANVRAVPPLKYCMAAGKNRVNMVEVRAREVLDKNFKLWSRIEGLTQTVGDERA